MIRLLSLLWALMNVVCGCIISSIGRSRTAWIEAVVNGGCGPAKAFPCHGIGSFINDIDDNPSLVNDEPLFEVDIKLGSEIQKTYVSDKIHKWFEEYFLMPIPPITDNSRKAHEKISRRWPEGDDGFPVVPYSFDATVGQPPIEIALQHWMEHTCILFKPVVDDSKPHIKFIKSDGCWSYIGMLFRDGQEVSIGDGCATLGIIAHEVGHAIGFWHEQSRGDRDQFIDVNYDHISQNMERNFAKYTELNYSVPYDYSSDMHYSSNAFTKDGKLTIATHDRMLQGLLGERTGLSHRDIIMANKMYECTDKWLAKCDLRTDPCENEGYIGKDCFCICPIHTAGKRCENVHGGYYDHLKSPKTETIYNETTISASLYGDRFVKYIHAPRCHHPKLIFIHFALEQKYGEMCKWEYLNIRKDDDFRDGEIYCHNEIVPGQEFISSSRDMMLYSMSKHLGFSRWEALLTFVEDPKCVDTTTPVEPTTITLAPVPNNTLELSAVHLVNCAKFTKIKKTIRPGDTILFSSPNFPHEYPSWSNCQLHISSFAVERQQRESPQTSPEFVTTCHNFHLEERDRHRCVDYLQIGHRR